VGNAKLKTKRQQQQHPKQWTFLPMSSNINNIDIFHKNKETPT